MKIFVLEDDSERMKYFGLVMINEILVMTNNVEQARKILENEKFDYIFLDHDLGGQVYVNSEDRNTGHYLCKHMNETLNIDTPIYVHSWNQNGAERMIRTLMDNGHNGKVEYVMYLTDEFHQAVKDVLDGVVVEVKEKKGMKTALQIAMEKIK